MRKVSPHSSHISRIMTVWDMTAEPVAIWRFTLYWTLTTMCTTFLIASLIAVFNLSRSILHRPHSTPSAAQNDIPLKPLSSTPRTPSAPGPSRSPRPASPITPYTPSAPLLSTGTTASTHTAPARRTRARRKRPPLWPLLLLPIGAVCVAAVIAVISATVIGFALAALYSAGGFSMST